MLRSACLTILGLSFAFQLTAQETLHEIVENMHYSEKSQLKQRAYEFLSSWNTSADLVKPAQKELQEKILENKQKRKDPQKGTEKLQFRYDEAVLADGTERSFLAETFAIPMLHELDTKGTSLEGGDIYTAQYVIKFVLGVPRFNYGELDIYNHNQMDQELNVLVSEYPDNDAHNQEVDGHVIDIFREEANAFFDQFVARNKAQLENQSGGYVSGGLQNMSCAEKYEYLKSKGIMH